MNENKKFSISNMMLAFITVLVVIGLVALAGFFLLTPPDDIIMGQAEATQVRISGKVPGRIASYRFGEGDQVKAGDTLVFLDTPEVMAKLKQAEAARAAAEAQNAKAIKGAREQEITAAYEMWQKAQAGLTIAKKSFDRIQNLYEKGVMSAQKRDEVEANYNAMVATEKAARSQYEMAKEGAREEDKAAAAAMVQRAEGAIAEVESYVGESALVAPIDGEVSERFPEVGELVGTGAPIMNISDLNDVWVTFSIREDLLKDIKIGSEVNAFIPALGDLPVKLKVYYMKDMGSYAAWKATKTNGQYDSKTFEVAQPIYFFCMLIAPAICVIFFVSLMHEGLPTDLPIAVVDMDNSATSRNLIRQLDAFEQTEVYMKTMSFTEARQEMQKGNVYGIFYIPSGFAVDATSGKQPRLSFYTNGTYLIAASLLFRDMKTMSVLAGAAVGLQTGQAKGYTEAQIMGQLQPIVIDTHPIGNPWLNYSVYLNNTVLPGIIQLMVFLVTVFSIGTEIKYSTSRKWLDMGGNSIAVSLLGKLLPQTAIFTVVGFMYCAVLYGINSFPLNSGWFPMLLAMFLLIISSQAVGVFMIGVLPTPRLGLSFASLFGMISFSIVGFSFPVQGMDPTLQALARLFPLRHYFLIYVDQALNGRALFYTLGEYAWLLGFLILPFLIGRNLKRALLDFKYLP